MMSRSQSAGSLRRWREGGGVDRWRGDAAPGRREDDFNFNLYAPVSRLPARAAPVGRLSLPASAQSLPRIPSRSCLPSFPPSPLDICMTVAQSERGREYRLEFTSRSPRAPRSPLALALVRPSVRLFSHATLGNELEQDRISATERTHSDYLF